MFRVTIISKIIYSSTTVLKQFFKKAAPNALFSVLILIILFLMDWSFSIYQTGYGFHLLKGDPIRWFIFLMLVSFTGNGLRTTILFITLLSSMLQLFHYQYLGTHIQPIAFYQILFNSGEVLETFADEIVTMIFPAALVCGAAAMIFTVSRRMKEKMRHSKYGAVALILIIALCLIRTHMMLNDSSGKVTQRQAKRLMTRAKLHSADNFQRSLRYFTMGILPVKVFGNVKIFPDIAPPHIRDAHPDRNIVLIIGESLRAKQLSLLGYDQNTTPMLGQVSGLFASTIYAGGTMTKTAIPVILNRLKYPGATSQIMSQENCLFKLAKENGFKTSFLSAQGQSNLDIINNLICTSSIDMYQNRSNYPTENDPLPDFDIALLTMLRQIDFSENNFIVLQQRGAHTPFKKQYPGSFEKFPLDYDNCVLYTDFVVHEIIRLIEEESPKETYFLFTSDHGELLNEEGLNGHGWFKSQVYEVPFLFYMFNHPGKEPAKELANIQCHYDLSNLIAQLLGYDAQVENNADKDIYVNGSDIDALAGYLQIQLKSSACVSRQIVR